MIGIAYARSYHIMVGTVMQLTLSTLNVKFGDYISPSAGVTNVRIPIPNSCYIQFTSNVVFADIP